MKSLLVIVLPMLLAAFGIGAVQEKSLEEQRGAMPMMMQDCPMKLQGTQVKVEDTAGGVALTFTNKPEKVVALQRRVERMARMHADAAKYEAIENGARLTLTPKDPARLAQFQDRVRAHVERMKKGECPMIHGMQDRDETDHRTHHP